MVLAAGVVVIGIAAGVIAIGRHSPSDSPPDSPYARLYLNSYDVTYEVTGGSHSVNMRYALVNTLVRERNNLDIAELTGPAPYSFPYLVNAMFPRGSHVFVEVRNNLPTGDVGCTIRYGLSSGSRIENRSAHGASVARCDVYLK